MRLLHRLRAFAALAKVRNLPGNLQAAVIAVRTNNIDRYQFFLKAVAANYFDLGLLRVRL